jgi:hypothetical protein
MREFAAVSLIAPLGQILKDSKQNGVENCRLYVRDQLWPLSADYYYLLFLLGDRCSWLRPTKISAQLFYYESRSLIEFSVGKICNENNKRVRRKTWCWFFHLRDKRAEAARATQVRLIHTEEWANKDHLSNLVRNRASKFGEYEERLRVCGGCEMVRYSFIFLQYKRCSISTQSHSVINVI